MADVEHIAACDYVGIVSGKNTPDKMEKAGFTTSKAEFVNAPIINELPMTIECRMTSYDEEPAIYSRILLRLGTPLRMDLS